MGEARNQAPCANRLEGPVRVRYLHKRSLKQKAWAYMQRNRVFRVGDMMMILEMEEEYARKIVRSLAQRGYLEPLNHPHALRDREYRVAKAYAFYFPKEKEKAVHP